MRASSVTVDSIPRQNSALAVRTLSSQLVLMLAWCVLLCLVVGTRLQWRAEPARPNDTFQYYSAADNILDGRIGYTSIVHFDDERAFGTTPAPLVHFPIGYPLLLAGFVALGSTPDAAAVAIDLLAAIVCLAFIAVAARRLRLSLLATNAALGGFVLNAAVARWATTALTEMVFAAAVTAGVVCLALPRRRESSATTAHALVAGLLFGLSYYLRYAGVFIVVGVAAATIVIGLRRDRLRFRQCAIATLVSGVVVAPWLIRNIFVVGDWRGGAEKVAWHPPLAMAVETARAVDQLLLGSRNGVPLLAAHVLWFVVAAAGVSVALWVRSTAIKSDHRTESSTMSDFIAVAGTMVLVYLACMFYAGMTTVISYGIRMFVPMLPLTFILIGCGIESLRSRLSLVSRPMQLVAAGILSLVMGGYVLLNLPRAIGPVDNARIDRIRASLFDETSTGQTAERALRTALSGHRRILANDGQAVGYFARIDTVSLVSTEFSHTEWTEAELRKAASTFDVGAFVIRRPNTEEAADSDIVPSEVVMQLANLTHPEWLVPVYVTDTLVIYQVRLEPRQKPLA